MQFTNEDAQIRTKYIAALRGGEMLCTYDGVFQPELYTRYCREIFQIYCAELERRHKHMSYQDIADYLNRG